MNVKYLKCASVLTVLFFIAGCTEPASQSTSYSNSAQCRNEKQDSITQNVYSEQAQALLDYFNMKFPNSTVTDECLVDVDNDGLEELLVALNTYSGISETQEEEARKNGFDIRYVGIIFPKGKNPTESVGILGKTVEKGMRFEGSDLFVVETKENLTDQVKVKMTNQNGKEGYFTVKLSFKDTTKNIQ